MSDPVTRDEQYLNQIGGGTGAVPEEAVTRVEQYLNQIMEGGTGGGGGGGGTAGVSSFNGRRNAVIPRAGDYNASQVTTNNASENVQQAIDRLTNTTTVDTEMSTVSQRPLTNSKVTTEINGIKGKLLPPAGATGDILIKRDSNDYNVQWANADNFMKKTDYDRDNNGKVDKAEFTDAVQGPLYSATLKNTRSNTTLITDDEKGVANGVVPLDSTRKILPEFLPDSITNGLTNGGIFNATTRVVRLSDAAKSILGVTSDTMVLQDSRTVPEGYPANAELYYITTAAGTFASMDFVEGDWLISLGNKWEQLRNGNQVSSVQGKTGAVTIDTDEVPQGTNNLYMTAAEKAKLRDIEAEATKDTNVVTDAQVVTLADNTKVLRLTNKNGTQTEFAGGGDVDLEDYLKKNGNASTTYAVYSPTGTRQTFTGSELMQAFHAKVVSWLQLVEAVGWSGEYSDLKNKPTRTSDFINDGMGLTNQPFITRTANNLANYYTVNDTYSKDEVDNLLDAIQGTNYIRVEELPTRDIDVKAIYYVPVDPSDETKGYNRYQRMSGRWVFLGTSDIDMNDYLKKDGNGRLVTATFTQAAERLNLASGDTIATAFGKLSKWFADFKEIAFSNSYKVLDDYDELALKEDLEDYVTKQQLVADAGKVLGIDSEGKVTPTAVSAGVARRSVGEWSVAWNDSQEDIKNEANGKNATAFGDHVIAFGDDKVAFGKYNTIDYSNTYAEQVGGGTGDNNRTDIRTLDWNGKGWYNNGVAVGNTTDHIIEPAFGNDLTTKTYVDRTIEEEIASAGLMKSMVVQNVPTVEEADANILYLVPDPTSEGHYLQYKKVLQSQNPDVYIMGNLGGTQLSMQGTQVKNLPIASRAIEGTVYQYIGNSAAYTFGGFYACLPTQLYGWMEASTGQMYWTDTLDIKYGDEIGDPVRNGTPILGTQVTDKYQVATYVGPTASYVDLPNRIRSTLGTWYTRDTNGDRMGNWHWVELIATKADIEAINAELANKQDKIIDGPEIAYLDDNLGLTHFEAADKTTHQIRGLSVWNYIKSKFTKDTLTTVSDSTKIGTVDNSKNNVVQEMTAKTLFDYMWKKIYPVGAVYISTSSSSPATLFGGTWSQIGDGYYLRASTSGGGSTLNEQLPNVTGSFRFSSGSQGHPEVSSPSGAFTTATNGNLTYPWPTDGTSGGPRTVNFSLKSFNNDLYVDNGAVQPKTFKVYMWRRTA